MVARANYNQPEPEEQPRSRSKSWNVPLDQIAFDQPTVTRISQPVPRPRAVTSSYQPAQAAPRPRNGSLLAQAHSIALAAGLAVVALVTYLLLSGLVNFVSVKLDDMQYGTTRTHQLDGFVGHGEESGVPSHFLAINLNRQISVIEMPGGDSSKARVITGPYLFGSDEDRTPARLRVADVNGDSKSDLLLNVKNEQIVYINDGQSFRALTPADQVTLDGR